MNFRTDRQRPRPILQCTSAICLRAALTASCMEATACALAAAGKGLWPAAWAYPVSPKYGAWAASGEVSSAACACSSHAAAH